MKRGCFFGPLTGQITRLPASRINRFLNTPNDLKIVSQISSSRLGSTILCQRSLLKVQSEQNAPRCLSTAFYMGSIYACSCLIPRKGFCGNNKAGISLPFIEKSIPPRTTSQNVLISSILQFFAYI